MGLKVTAAVSTAALTAALASTLALASSFAQAKETTAASQTVVLAQLPSQAQKTYNLIRAGGPFPYPKDGVVFGNRERLLPIQPRGYYREYTVPTPQSRNRGARRIVCGGQPPTQPQACYYTGDHYASFSRIVAE
ncbi:MAG TPA: ribonuclease [Burkholderiaceae bacterium]